MVDFHKVCQVLFQDEKINYNRSSKFVKFTHNKNFVRNEDELEPYILGRKKYVIMEKMMIEEQLEKKRKDVVHLLEQVAEEKLKLVEAEEQFKQEFIKFEYYVKINFEKKKRARDNITQRKIMAARSEQDIEMMRKRVETCKKFRTLFAKHIQKHTIYEKYLKQVVDFTNEFKNVDDIINRYLILQSKEGFIAEKEIKAKQNLEHLPKEKYETRKILMLQIVNLYNILSMKFKHYEQVTTSSRFLEHLKEQVFQANYDKLGEVVMTMQGIENLNEMMDVRHARVDEDKKWDQPLHYTERVLNINSKLKAIANVSRRAFMRWRLLKRLYGQKLFNL